MLILKSLLKFVLVAAILIVQIVGIGFVSTAYGQSATATLGGTVVDAQGAVVAGADVTVTDTAKAVERRTTTNEGGYFTLTQLPPSAYTINVERAGFTTSQLPDVVLNVNDQSALRVTLKSGKSANRLKSRATRRSSANRPPSQPSLTGSWSRINP